MYCVCAKNYIFHPPHPWYSPLVLHCSYVDLFPHWFHVCVFDGLLHLFPGFINYAICSGLNPKEKNLCIYMDIILQSGHQWLVICYSSDCFSSYFSTRLCSDSCVFTNLTLKAETTCLLQGLVHKLCAAPSSSHIPKWKSLYLWNWSVFTALGHWGLLTVMPHLWQESMDFLITIFFICTAFQLCSVLNCNSDW